MINTSLYVSNAKLGYLLVHRSIWPSTAERSHAAGSFACAVSVRFLPEAYQAYRRSSGGRKPATRLWR